MFTIGHSTRSSDEFIALLKENNIQLLADIRHFPGSRKYPHFSKENLQKSLPEAGINYRHFLKLGGRRRASKDSVNTVWRNAAFRGYADYMQTPEFHEGIENLLAAGDEKHIAIMCSEAVWWRCHRSMVSDYLKSIGLEITHILGHNQLQTHPYTAPARIVNGELTYKTGSDLFI